jgi:NAD(P)H-dependent FMN reductase
MTPSRTEKFNQHHVWLQRAFAKQPDDIGAASLQLWELLAQELTGIIGEAGFESLYSRCVYLLRGEFSWLQFERLSTQISARFIDLNTQLNQQERSVAERASRALFDTFIQLLSGLIGTGLTLNILHVAWNGVFPDLPEVPDDPPEHE